LVYRTAIEQALDEIISNEEGMRFQGIAVVLAKQKWPDLIACERKKDQGVDAYAPASLAADRLGKVLACSITATLGKINGDARSVKKHYNDIKVLIFATPQKVHNPKASEWAKKLYDKFGYELVVMPREDIITSLLLPSNASICRTQLRISVPIEAIVQELIERAQAATSELTAAWLANPRLAGRPHINLHAVKLGQEGKETSEKLNLESLQTALLEGRRIVLEAPAGRGKTTTLIQLAKKIGGADTLAVLIDLPAWAKSRLSILDFIARMPPFLSRNIDAGNLAKLHQDAQLLFLLNGWNEISEAYSEDVTEALRGLERDFPKAGIIVATRNHYVSPPLPGAFRARLLSLDKTQRTEYLHQALGIRADELILKLNTNPVLDDLTRTPLILSEVTAIFKSGGEIPPTKIGVLGEVMRLLEQSDEHRNHLQDAPLRGHAPEYLTELAIQMTERGDTTIAEKEARAFVNSVSKRLSDGGQIATLPEPASVLNTLCAHHILERLDFPSVAFRFEHQQFQELYAAVFLKRQLNELVMNENHDCNQAFAKQYVNEPVWEEPLRMVAEELGVQSVESSDESDSVKAGKRLVEMALNLDPIFAATLSRLGGKEIWGQVRTVLGTRLRSWYALDDENHRQCALAGILASGSPDFSDIILPLLSSDDQQTRLSTYRAGTEFYLSSLGSNWREVVMNWQEEARIDFITEMAHNQGLVEIAEEFALSDPSTRVKIEAISILDWFGLEESYTRCLEALDKASLAEAIQELWVEEIPLSLRPQTVATYQNLLSKAEEAGDRLRILLGLAKLEDTDIPQKIKDELARWSPDKPDERLLQFALNVLQKSEPDWVSHWVAERIASGSLWHQHWLPFVSSIPSDLKDRWLDKIGSEDIQHRQSSGIISVLAATGDAALAEAVFVKLCEVQRSCPAEIGAPREDKRAIARQLIALLRTLAPNIVVTGLSNYLACEYDLVETAVLIEVFSDNGREKADLREQLQDELRQRLRRYLKQSVPWVLKLDDFTGEIKVHLASALSRVGEPEDMQVLRQLIWADIERVRKRRAARSRGEQNELAKYCMTWMDHWHVAAVVSLDAVSAETLLLEILGEWEYETSAAPALVRLATIKNRDDRTQYRRNYRLVWEAQGGHPPIAFEEDRRQRYAVAFRQRIHALLEERTQSDDPKFYHFRIKGLALHLAALDSQNSRDLVLQMMALPGEWDGYKRCDALDALLLGGAKLPTEASLLVLNPTIEHFRAQGLYNKEQIGTLKRCLCFLPFLDDASVGIARIRQILAETTFPAYELRDIVTALGYSRCQDALPLLKEIATLHQQETGRMFGEWIEAVALLGGSESQRILLSFIDPDADELGIQTDADHFGGAEILVARLTEIAQEETDIKQRIFQFCEKPLPQGKRHLLAKVLAKLGTGEAILAGLNLIDDKVRERIPFELWRAIEHSFLERIPGTTNNSFTLASRNANEIRARLYEIAQTDVRRKRSAFHLLGQIEVWRLKYGKPSTEPRHPFLSSGNPWPNFA